MVILKECWEEHFPKVGYKTRYLVAQNHFKEKKLFKYNGPL